METEAAAAGVVASAVVEQEQHRSSAASMKRSVGVAQREAIIEDE